MSDVDTLHNYFEELGVISSRTGIIKMINEFKPEIGDSSINIFGAETISTEAIGGEGVLSLVGGASFNRNDAYLACIGEALERYAAAFVKDVKVGAASEIPNAVMGWPTFSEISYKHTSTYVPFTEDTEISWTSAINFHTGMHVMVPASLVYLPWKHSRDPNTVFPSISTGLSSHRTLRKAIEGSIYELIERDAFTLAWLSGQPLPTVPQNWVKHKLRDLGVPDSWRVRIVDLTNDTGAFTYLTSIFAPTAQEEIFAVGCSTHINQMTALLNSIEEALHTVPYVRFLLKDDPNWDPGEKLENLHTFEDHCKLYSVREDLQEGLKYIFPEDPEITAPIPGTIDGMCSFDNLIARLNDLNINLYVKRLTTRDVQKIGFEVSRVISPQLMPLHSHYQLPYLNCDRLWNLEEIFPFEIKNLQSEKEVYPYPHPFA